MYICYQKTEKLLKKEHKTYQLFNNYCVRTPFFPINFYKKFGNASEKKLKEVVLNPVFRETLFLASPELFNQILKWEKGEITNPKKIEKLQFAILKYATRISSRCTPFGLFASCGIVEFGLETNIQLNTKQDYKRATRFDTTFLNQISQKLLKNKIIRENVLLYSNTSIYRIGNHYRYVEYTLEKKRRSYSLEGLVYSEYLEIILKEAKAGKTIKELSNLLVDDEITKEDAIGFIEDLINNQILVSELEITVTGEDYFKNLLIRIKEIPETSTIQQQLSSLQQQLNTLDLKIGNQTDVYKEIIANAKNLVPELDTKYLFQTDTFTSFKNNSLDNNIKKQLNKAFVLFNKMTLPLADGNIERFKRDFLKRFEQSEISLNLALDTETGIGYGNKREDSNNLLESLVSIGNKKRYEHFIWTDVDTILQKKLVNATQNRSYSISLTENDLKELPITWNDLPDTLSSIIEIYKIENKETIFIKNIGGASATYLLGRFGQGSKKISETIYKIAKVEETINSDKILAEIVHLPEARTGNILQRPSFREYEIPYLGKSSVLSEYQIPIEDILVSIKDDTIILRSKKLNKEIVPRLGNAHNYSGNPLPIYQFLCDIQTQNKRSSVGFSWNEILKKHTFLPRIEFENMIFSKATWNIEVAVFQKLFANKNLLASIKIWQKENLIPDFVELVEGDNKLLIDLKSEISIRMLLDTIKNRKKFILEEFLFLDNEFIKDEKDASYCNQFVVSFYNEAKLKQANNE